MAKILLVDDDEVTIGLINLYLAKYDHDVTMARDGKEAFKLLDVEKFDILITDIIMPEMDGYGLLLLLSMKPTRPKIIAISAGALELQPEEVLKPAKSLKVEETLTKPVTSEALIEAVNRLLTLS